MITTHPTAPGGADLMAETTQEQETQEGRKHYGDTDAVLGLGSDGLRVYVIDDGGRHHYVARSAWEALTVHIVDHESEAGTHPGEDVTVTLLAPGETLTVGYEDMPGEGGFPPAFTVTLGESRTMVAATAAEWAWLERADVDRRGAVQLCSSEW